MPRGNSPNYGLDANCRRHHPLWLQPRSSMQESSDEKYDLSVTDQWLNRDPEVRPLHYRKAVAPVRPPTALLK
jgi:hypothetical protein